jgi:hypothetical protein
LSLYGKPSAGLRGRTFSVSSIKREVNKKNNSPRELEFFRFAAQLAIRSTP